MSDRDALKPLFAPKSVALIGASDRNPWCGLVLLSLDTMGFAGKVHLINKSGKPALGRETVASCSALGAPVDAAFIAVPSAALEEALQDMAAAGIRHGVVVTSGFSEVGAEGAAEQIRVFAMARELGLELLGPNSLGVMNCVDGVALTAIPVPSPLISGGRIGLISQSGATSSNLQEYAARQGIGFSHSVSLGNEAMIDLSRIIDFMLDDEATRAIAVYAEAIRDGAAFVRACDRALLAGKPIVMLKVGVGELAAQVAQAHTGALVGDDRIFDAVCRRDGVIRVRSLEQLILTADLLAHTGVLDPRPIAAMSISGGACGMVADMGEAAAVPFARLGPATVERLQAILPDYGVANNPLDITGGAMADVTMFGRAIDALDADPEVGLILCIHEVPQTERQASPLSTKMTAEIGAALSRAATPGLVIQQSSKPSGEFGRKLATDSGVPYVTSSLAEIVKAIGCGRTWSDSVRRRRTGDRVARSAAPASARPVGERQTLEYLATRGVPVIPAKIARSAAEASSAATGGPVALKILSPDIAHKTEIGGVLLGCSGDGVATGYERIMANVAAARSDARIEGVLVSPMRERQAEMFVGVARDPTWGLALALGLGGIWVELLGDVSLRLLPLVPDDVLQMLGELKGARLLDGYRGSPAVDRHELARIVAAIGDAAFALGPELVSLEINPLNIGPAGIEALDALTVWA